MLNKITVAHVIRVFSYGGAEISLKELLATEVLKENCISDLFILDHKKLGLVADVQPTVRNVYHYKITNARFLFEYIRFLRMIATGKYNIVHMHLPVSGCMTIVAKIFCSRKTKFVYTEHSLVTFYSKLNYYLSGLTYRFNDSVIAVSDEVSSEIQKRQKPWFFKRKNPITILNGINTEKFFIPGRTVREKPFDLSVGLVARFRPNKRIDRWVEVAEKIHLKNSIIKFILVGDGPDDEAIRRKVAEKNMTGIIQFPGKTNDTVNAYRQIDVFLLTSDQEGLPLSLMEAMSCGCVPVVNDIGGIRQLDFKGIGLKFNNFDAERIAEKILSYAEQPEQYFIESIKAREYVVTNCSLTKQANEIVGLYNNLLHH
ncbi:MAG TPA: glycosyltransferase [Panacibacter sp.]|nr:glycosyltransferase [Panacibacter sp.]